MPLSPRTSKFLHYHGYLELILSIVAGAICLIAIPLWYFSGQPMELEGVLILSVVGSVGLGYGTFELRRHIRRNPTTPIPTVDDLPPAQAATQIRSGLWIIAVLTILVTAFMAYQLTQLEFGLAQRVTVWHPIATMYKFFGFWPAVLFVPVLGLLILFSLARKLRALKEGQTGRI